MKKNRTEKQIRDHYDSKTTDDQMMAMDYVIDGKPLSTELYHDLIVAPILKHMDFKEDDIVFDVGCGAGIVLSCIENKVKHVEGLDISEKLISFYTGAAKLHCCSVMDFEFKEAFYTKIFMTSVSIHFPDFNYFKNVVHKLLVGLAPGGVLLIGDQLIDDFYSSEKYFCLKLKDLLSMLKELNFHFSIMAQSKEFRYRNRYDILIYK